MDSIAVIDRRAARAETRAHRRPVTVDVTAEDGSTPRKARRCRPSRRTADSLAIAASSLGIA